MILARIALGIGLLFIVSLVIFGATELLPGDIAHTAPRPGRHARDRGGTARAARAERPAAVRYWNWLRAR
jgi:peptide/nickel transport system permease protein